AHDIAQMRHSYPTPRPGADFGPHVFLPRAVIDYAVTRRTTLAAFSPLINGSLTRPDRELPQGYRHAGTVRELAALNEVARRRGATANQVVLAWMLGGEPAIVPVLGVSKVTQLDEALDALDLVLDVDDWQTLSAARAVD
ncbi:MAG: aldo/keto reductase, partial [Actinomycetota bacterium]